MPVRAMWKGRLQLGGVGELAVKLYAALEDRRVHFRLLHRSDLVGVRQRMVDRDSGEPVEREEMRKAAPDAEGNLVVIDDEEQRETEPAPSRTIEILSFHGRGAIPHSYYERPYYLGPDGDAGVYAAFAAALEAEDAEAIVRWVMRKREYVGALSADEGLLTVVTLRPAEEVLEVPRIEEPGDRAPSKKEVAMARQLIEALAGPFEPEQYTDTYRAEVVALAERKARGEQVARERPRAPAASESLRASLEASLAATKAS